MHYVVYRMNFENPLSEVFHSYNDAYKRAKELVIDCDNYDYIVLCKVENNNEQLIRVFATY